MVRHREFMPTVCYHVMAPGNDGQKVFLSQSDCQAFIEALPTVRQRS
jgi:hypothetical protein